MSRSNHLIPKQLTEDLYMLPGIVNMYLIDAPEGLTLIDAGFPNGALKILDALTGLDRSPEDLRHIILTHAHPDHIGGLAAIVNASGARTYMHSLDAPIAEVGTGFRPMRAAPGVLAGVLFRLLSRPNVSVDPVHIDQHLSDGDVVPIAGGLEVIHVPGHCAGQVALLRIEWGVLFAGDVCTHVMGLGAPIGYEDRAEGERSQRKLGTLSFDMACFGHGAPIERAAAARFRRSWPDPGPSSPST